jgi:hypothetical protein
MLGRERASMTAPREPICIFLYGPPAVGKLTVARALAERREFRVLHNHLTFDPVAEILPIGTPGFWATVDRVRVDLVRAAVREGIDLVCTFVFAPGDEDHVDDVATSFEAGGGFVIFVQLVAPPDELRRRVSDASRMSYRKITDPASLDEVLREHDVHASIPNRESLTIDVTEISPEDAAGQIVEHIDAFSGRR